MPKKSTQATKINKKELQLPEGLSDLEPNLSLIHLNVVRQNANKRAGTASTKTRSEVRGGGKKPWKQKGTGRARAGSLRSPLFVGGGITFGPKPRNYEFDIPQKARKLSTAQALSSAKEKTSVIDSIPELEGGKTKALAAAVADLNPSENKVLFVVCPSEKNYDQLERASRNLKNVEMKVWNCVGAYDIILADQILITEEALKGLTGRLERKKKSA